jgi:hypothetical protein
MPCFVSLLFPLIESLRMGTSLLWNATYRCIPVPVANNHKLFQAVFSDITYYWCARGPHTNALSGQTTFRFVSWVSSALFVSMLAIILRTVKSLFIHTSFGLRIWSCWLVTPYISESALRFEGTHRLHLQGWKVSQARNHHNYAESCHLVRCDIVKSDK